MKKYGKVCIGFVTFGLLLCVVGLILIFLNVGKPFIITNLRPIILLVVGFFLFIIGAIIVDFTVRICWLRRIEQKIDSLDLV